MAKKKVASKKAVSGKKRKPTAYNKLQKAVAARCKNNTSANQERVKKAKIAYVNDAIKKGKTSSEAKKSANKADTCNPFGK